MLAAFLAVAVSVVDARSVNDRPLRMKIAENASELCGAWCSSPTVDPASPCIVDEKVIPCAGAYCSSTCGLWNLSVLLAGSPLSPPISCDSFVNFGGYPLGAVPCAPECLVDEIKPTRYPAPLGFGLLCAPGTCDPSTQARYANTSKALEGRLGVLECPCNWFGADCPDDWVQVEAVLRKRRLGDVEHTVFGVSPEGWHNIMASHRLGGTVRVQSPSDSAWGRRPLEQPYALAADGLTGAEVGEVEVLTGPPDVRYHPTVTEVAQRVRALPVGPIQDAPSPLFINPSVGGFFNARYEWLSDEVASRGDQLDHVVIISTGTGISSARHAIAELIRRPRAPRVHLYYGVRDARHLPFREELAGWVAAGRLALTLAVSGRDQEARQAPEPEIAHAITRGGRLANWAARATSAMSAAFPFGRPPARLRKLLPRPGHGSGFRGWLLGHGARAYVQHIAAVDLAVGPLRFVDRAAGHNTAVVIVGRAELLDDGPELVAAAVSPGVRDAFRSQRVFANI